MFPCVMQCNLVFRGVVNFDTTGAERVVAEQCLQVGGGVLVISDISSAGAR